MGNELSTELKTIQDRVRDRIQSEFIQLIPKDMWDKMVADELQKFITTYPAKNHWDKDIPSPLARLIQEQIEAVAKAKIREEFSTGRWTANWNGVSYEASEATKKLVVEHGDLILKTILKQMMEMIAQNAIENFKNSLHSMR